MGTLQFPATVPKTLVKKLIAIRLKPVTAELIVARVSSNLAKSRGPA